MATPPHMILNPNRGAGRFLHGPFNPNHDAEAIVLAPIDVATYPLGFPDGTLLAKITAAGATIGQYAPHDPGAADGTENTDALVILYGDRDASAVAQPAVGVARNVTVNANLLNYAVALTGPQKVAALAALASPQQIIARY